MEREACGDSNRKYNFHDDGYWSGRTSYMSRLWGMAASAWLFFFLLFFFLMMIPLIHYSIENNIVIEFGWITGVVLESLLKSKG